jgi:hypothetical protein
MVGWGMLRRGRLRRSTYISAIARAKKKGGGARVDGDVKAVDADARGGVEHVARVVHRRHVRALHPHRAHLPNMKIFQYLCKIFKH